MKKVKATEIAWFMLPVFMLAGMGFILRGKQPDDKIVQASSAEELIRLSFREYRDAELRDLQNQPDGQIGWPAVQVMLLKAGASPGEARSVLQSAQTQMGATHRGNDGAGTLGPVLPVLAQRGLLNNKPVWVIEGIASSVPYTDYCTSGMTPQQRNELFKQKEVCAHRVLIVSAKPPYTLLKQDDR